MRHFPLTVLWLIQSLDLPVRDCTHYPRPCLPSTTNSTRYSYLITSLLARRTRQRSHHSDSLTPRSSSSVNNSKSPRLFHPRDEPSPVSASNSSPSSLLSSLSSLFALAHRNLTILDVIGARLSRVYCQARDGTYLDQLAHFENFAHTSCRMHRVTRFFQASLLHTYTTSNPSITHASKSSEHSISLYFY